MDWCSWSPELGTNRRHALRTTVEGVFACLLVANLLLQSWKTEWKADIQFFSAEDTACRVPAKTERIHPESRDARLEGRFIEGKKSSFSVSSHPAREDKLRHQAQSKLCVLLWEPRRFQNESCAELLHPEDRQSELMPPKLHKKTRLELHFNEAGVEKLFPWKQKQEYFPWNSCKYENPKHCR